MDEVWQSINGFENKYHISNKGRVWANTQMGQRFLKPWEDGHGYYVVELYGEKTESIREKVHRLVACMFVVKPEGKTEVNHIDGNKTNNDFRNLEWVTSAENTAHAHRTGLIPKRIYMQGGEKNPSAKLTKEKVEEIRRMHSKGEKTTKELSELFEVHYVTIQRIVTKKSWK